MVYIDHGLGVISLYAHMNNVKVKPDQWIKKGDVIAYLPKAVGTGNGTHIHFNADTQDGEFICPSFFIE